MCLAASADYAIMAAKLSGSFQKRKIGEINHDLAGVAFSGATGRHDQVETSNSARGWRLQ